MRSSFKYTYVDENGLRKTSSIEAETLLEAQEKLNVKNIAVIDITESHQKTSSSFLSNFFDKKISRRELIEFCIYLGTLTEAGYSLVAALSDFSSETKNLYFKKVIDAIRVDVENGNAMSDSLSKFPRVFSKETICLIRAGEQTGTLPNSFKELRSYFEWTERVNADVKQATTYPAFVSVILMLFILFLFSNIIPKVTKVFVDMKLQLPAITKVLVFLSTVAAHTWYLWLMAGIAAPLAIKIGAKRNPAFAFLIDSMKLRVPVFGALNRLIIQSRFTQNFATLHRSGISILENLELCKGFIGNRVFIKAIEQAYYDVQEGVSLSASLKGSGLFSMLIVRMFAIGEASGALDASLIHAAVYYNEEVPRRVKRVFTILEPLIILFLVFVVGSVALGIFLPILSISKGLHI
jgi:type II secretory pathway component PulF